MFLSKSRYNQVQCIKWWLNRNFYDQPISDQFKKHNEIRKIATGKGDDYTSGCLLDC